MDLELDSEAGTVELGRWLGAMLRGGDVLALVGPLGAGKTTLVRAIAGAMGIDARLVSSPTFVIVNEYPGGDGPDLVHVDAYRLGSADELETVGWDRVLHRADAAVVVEWADRIAESLPGSDRLGRVQIEATGRTSRRVRLEIPSAWSDRATRPLPARSCGCLTRRQNTEAPDDAQRTRRGDSMG